MKKIKMIDLANMIVNGEKLPKRIKLLNPIVKPEYRDYHLTEDDYYETDFEEWTLSCMFGKLELNDEVEIVEE